MIQYKVHFDDLAWERPMEGIRCKSYKDSHRQLRLVVYTREMAPHWCEKGHYGIILDGQFEIEYLDTQVIYQTGDGVFIPPGKEHKHKAKVLSEYVRALFVEDV